MTAPLTLARIYDALDTVVWLSLEEVRARLPGVRGGQLRRGLWRLIGLELAHVARPASRYAYQAIPGAVIPDEDVPVDPPKRNPNRPDGQGDILAQPKKSYVSAFSGRKSPDSVEPKTSLKILQAEDALIAVRRNGYVNAACDEADKVAAKIPGATDAHRCAALAIEREAMIGAVEMLEVRIASARLRVLPAPSPAKAPEIRP